MSDVTLPPELAAIYDRLAQIGQHVAKKNIFKAPSQEKETEISAPNGISPKRHREDQPGIDIKRE